MIVTNKTSFFKKADGEWYNEYHIEDDQRHVGVGYVEVNKTYYHGGMIRISVWGNDDCGVERDSHDSDGNRIWSDEAQETLFGLLAHKESLSREWCIDVIGMVRA